MLTTELTNDRASRSHSLGANVVPGGARGFTLIEVMVVIAILLAIVGLVAVNVIGRKKDASVGTTQIQLKTLKSALDTFFADFDRYPTDEEGLTVLWNKTTMAEEDQAKWKGYMSEPVPTDTWSSAWGYRQTGERAPEGKFDLWSNGPDKQEGTDDDIHVWKTAADDEGMSDTPPPPPPTGG
ncbi:MAG: type II secretion system major pseudopilin GspG [Phycisphaerales bacterium]|nr:type II secretion system major pseudopilin GspG [Phycisphaerales bacterium]